MKRYINKFVGVALAISILPQLAFAAWWNPLSWFDGWFYTNKEDKTEQLENKINNATTSTSSEQVFSKPSISRKAPTVEKDISINKNINKNVLVNTSPKPTTIVQSVTQPVSNGVVVDTKAADLKKAQDAATYAASQKAYEEQQAETQAEKEKSARLQSWECVNATYNWNQIKDVTFWTLTNTNGSDEAKKKTKYVNVENTYETACNGKPKVSYVLCSYLPDPNEINCDGISSCAYSNSQGVCTEYNMK